MALSDAFLRWYLPMRPRCCDRYDEQRRRPREDALKRRLIEPNPATLCNLLVADIDDEDGRQMALWDHQGFLPNFLAENPANGHVHAGWVLTSPVPTTEYSRRKPIALANAVTEGLRRSCDGDAAYTGHLMKNPLHPAWNSELVREETYGLEELREALEASGDMPPKSWKRTKRARTTGLGRNCTVFGSARVEAYREVRRIPDRTPQSSDMLREYIRRLCHEINAGFPDPLPVREVNQIAKSIHKWITTQSRMWCDGAAVNAAVFSTIQSYRGKKGGKIGGVKSGTARRNNKSIEQLKDEVLAL
ncbi:replication protein [Bifidobacterium margollesii]|uniref:Replication protein n=1 Tax=Bifidobacterium margollesii TaxID=2020964 RepID=A0A2N5J6R7_9BIFI|nr:replication initiation protein [Bifidobacterium margollesii]PLS29893.1 replication protein [Bifidobacterium margollesii]